MNGFNIHPRFFGCTIESSCKFIGWFEFATGFFSVISYLILIVIVGVYLLKNQLENVADSAKYFIIGACGLSAVLIEFYMMLGWYLLLGVYKEDPVRLLIWVRASIILHSSIAGVLALWIVGLCFFTSAVLLIAFPTCDNILKLSFGVYGITVVKSFYEQLMKKNAGTVPQIEDEKAGSDKGPVAQT